MKPDWTAPATLLADPEWVRTRIGGAAKLYGCARPEVLGTIWWYSLSSVLVAPAVESLVAAASAGRALDGETADRGESPERADRVASPSPTGTAPAEPSALSAPADPAAANHSAGPVLADPSLDAMELDLLADGRFLGARSTRPLSGGLPELGAALAGALGAAIATVAAVTGARARALGAIATDSIGNRLLWTPDPERAMALAEPLVAAIGLGLPKPRFVRVGRTPAVRRASCCLIYEVGNPKCVSCPRQTPAERDARLRAALG
ncbi:(2Fe-2S)-binding protein [Amycolatopsis sp. cmx-4-68]|uniref:(2Fe-2S)-binding protein n=1 Tax=Amycolatopsis sp. cmx-4-68 TaxID=2790938 RepID=UPI00397CA1A5